MIFPHTFIYLLDLNSNSKQFYCYTRKCLSQPLHISFHLWYIALSFIGLSLHWRHNDHYGVSNHQPHSCLLNRLFRRRSSKFHVTGLCVGNSPGPVNSPHKGPVTRKMFPFDDVIMDKCRWCPPLLRRVNVARAGEISSGYWHPQSGFHSF